MTQSRTIRQKERAIQLRNFLVHLAIYVAASAYLVLIDLVDGADGETFVGLDWAHWPILVWLAFVFVHAVSFVNGGDLKHTDPPSATELPDDSVTPDSKAA